MLIRRSVVPAALLLALSAGCANNTGNSGIDAGAPAPASSSVVPESATTSDPATEPSAGKPSGDKGSVTTLTGKVTAGVEPNCLLLDNHLLIFNDAAQKGSVKAGDEITVTGKPDSGLMTTCMQGEPFVVTSVAGS